MTTLKNLLEEVKIGKDNFEEITKTEYFSESVDTDYNLFLTSKVIYDKINEVDETFHKGLKAIAHKFSETEKRILEGKRLSKVYGMIKADGIVKDYNALMEVLSEDRKLYNKEDKRTLADIFGSIKVGLNNLCEDINYQHHSMNDGYGVLESYITKSVTLINETLS